MRGDDAKREDERERERAEGGGRRRRRGFQRTTSCFVEEGRVRGRGGGGSEGEAKRTTDGKSDG